MTTMAYMSPSPIESHHGLNAFVASVWPKTALVKSPAMAAMLQASYSFTRRGIRPCLHLFSASNQLSYLVSPQNVALIFFLLVISTQEHFHLTHLKACSSSWRLALQKRNAERDYFCHWGFFSSTIFHALFRAFCATHAKHVCFRFPSKEKT